MTLLSTRGLSRNFGGLKAVDNVDFDLPAGEVRALIGPNGAGKTTFVGMLSGRIPASAGTVRFDGRDVTTMPARIRRWRRMSRWRCAGGPGTIRWPPTARLPRRWIGSESPTVPTSLPVTSATGISVFWKSPWG